MRPRRVFRAALAALALGLFGAAGSAAAAKLTGTVRDRAGQPIEFASVSVPALRVGVVTGADGRFDLEVPDGALTVVISQMGYLTARVELTAAPATPLAVVLAEQPVPVAEVRVEASSFGRVGKSEGAVVRRMDVYTTPGGAADILQSLRGLPGLNAPVEGAALYVRGGEPRESVIRIDGVEIGHPYHYEGASGGLFSILDTYMLKSAFFSSGGFPARYGDAMSGVLDIETQDPLNLRTATVGANLAGGGASSTWALVPDRLSLITSMQRSAPSLLFRLYGNSREFESSPASTNGVAKLLGRYSPTGRVSLLALQSVENIAVRARVLNVDELVRSEGRNQFAALALQDVVLDRIAVRAHASLQRYRNAFAFSAFEKRSLERTTTASVDATWPMGDRQELSLGALWRRRAYDLAGVEAADSTLLGSGAPSRSFASEVVREQPGVHVEHRVRVFGPVYATAGGRFDRLGPGRAWTADPRGALAWRLDSRQTLRVAGGRYHQAPPAASLDPRYGNPRLGTAHADHAILAYEWKSDYANVRVEAYDKRYRGLPVSDSVTWWSAEGTGRSRGVDLFTQGSWKWWSGWVSYGWLDARRREQDDPAEVRARWGVQHALTLVGQYSVSSKWQTGFRYGWSSGRPYTPVIGATRDLAGVVRPVFGARQSALLPAYQRLDVRLTRLFSLPRGAGLPPSGACVAYAEALNLLGIRNVRDWSWNADYTARRPVGSYFDRRMIVAGFSLSW